MRLVAATIMMMMPGSMGRLLNATTCCPAYFLMTKGGWIKVAETVGSKNLHSFVSQTVS
jgi:hypothetical protein